MKGKRVAHFVAATIITGETPLHERLKILDKYFQPRLGQELKLDEYALKEFGKKDKDQGLIYGEIIINPPKGQCLTITRSLDQPDSEICKKTPLRWRLQDLDRHTGRLDWSVKTGEKDFGTPISWKTKYIIAKIIPSGFEFYEANSTPLFITECNAVAADPANFRGRRINLSLLNGETWTIRFPDRDEPLPAYEPPAPPPPPEDDKKKQPAHGDEHGEAKKAEPEKPKETPPPPEDWTMSTRRGYVMDVSHVIAGSATAPGTKGKCRYQYDGTIGDFDTGRIECHYGDRFLYFYSPLPCLKYIMPPVKK